MKDRTSKAGMGPGSLVYIGEKRNTPVTVRVMDYDASNLTEFVVNELSECDPFVNTPSVTWIDVDGIHNPKIIESIGQKFGIHILVLEDVMNTESRPKVEFFDNYMFITMKMIDQEENSKDINVEQFSIVVGENYILTFQERPGDSFNPIRDRIRTSKGRVRSKNANFLAYLLLDVIVDNYISLSDNYSDRIDALESEVLKKPSEATLHRILDMRKQLLDFKRSIDPLKEAVNAIQKELDEDIAKYYRDLHDHIIYESENLSVYREMLVNLLDLYHSSLSTRMNSVMKVLTVITTIFVPLTFLVGVYGMNFDHMPELHWHNGYFYLIGIMILVVIGQLYYFSKRKWL